MFPGLSILSGTEAALSLAESLVATAFVESFEKTKAQLVETGWSIGGIPRVAKQPAGSRRERVDHRVRGAIRVTHD